MKSALNHTLLALALATLSGSALAANTSAAKASAVAPSVMDKMTANFTAIAFGPSMSEPTSSLQPDAMTGQLSADPVFMKDYLSLGYKLGNAKKIEAIAYWTTKLGRGWDYTIRDPYLKASDGKFISMGNLSMAADVRLAPPVYLKSRNDNMIAYLMSKQVTTYTISGSRFTPGIITYALYRQHANNLHNGQLDLETYAGPNVDYKITDTLSANVLYEMGANHIVGQGFDLVNAGTDLEPGIAWDITPKMTLNPFLDIKTGQRIAFDTTTYNLYFTWSML